MTKLTAKQCENAKCPDGKKEGALFAKRYLDRL